MAVYGFCMAAAWLLLHGCCCMAAAAWLLLHGCCMVAAWLLNGPMQGVRHNNWCDLRFFTRLVVSGQ
jgi:hypothetical protein